MYFFYGGNRAALCCRDPEFILAGPADTGKTFMHLCRLHMTAFRYPGASLVMVRRKREDIYGSIIEMFRKKVLPFVEGGELVTPYGGEKPQWYDYPYDSRIWVTGLYGSGGESQITGKVLSSEHDMICVFQAEELALAEWETLASRCTGRAGHVPYPQLVGDCNPAGPSHWIKRRAAAGALRLIKSSHRDNPELFDPATGLITPDGERRLSRLRALTGARLQRLYYGKWVAPEGAIFEVFNEQRHVCKAFHPDPRWPVTVGVDPVGEHTAAVWTAWDSSSKILHVYREYYEPYGLPSANHAENIKRLGQSDNCYHRIEHVGGGPSERQARLDWAYGGLLIHEPPIWDVWAGIDKIIDLLHNGGLVIHENCARLIDEITSYQREVDRHGEPAQRIKDKEAYHLLDALRYAVVWLAVPTGVRVTYEPGRII